ncbi:partitioning defective 3 homolog B isoform X3 [Oryzias latipes]
MKMKVTVTFGQTGVVVPCKEGWTVRDLIQQATQRYRKLLEQEGDVLVRTHHVEYCDGGILDPDDILSDLVDDRDKLMAVYEEQEAQQTAVANSRLTPSPDLHQAELSVFQPTARGEIEVNSSALKSGTPLLVRSSSDSALTPQTEIEGSFSQETPVKAASPPVEKPGGLDGAKHAFNGSLTRSVEVLGDDSPLGIHVVPYCSSLSGRFLGLYIRGVEEKSRSRKEGLLQEDECIVRINNTDLMDKTFSQAQDIFRQAMRSPVIFLEVVPPSNKDRYERSLIGQLSGTSSGATHSGSFSAKAKDPPPPIKAKPVFKPPENLSPRQTEDASPPEPVATLKGRSESPLLRKSPAFTSMVTNKRGGRKLRIDLTKGSEGLGFTVVTRDSSVHGPGPILVKNILPRGAAVKDGRLQSGDRILEVNGVDITGVGQEELVCLLRSTRQGETVSLGVLRQEDVFLPRETKEEVPRVAGVVLENGKEQLMFEIPLNDSGSAGLGVSLKGNKSRETREDLGIFIKSIIHGGAAYKDGRLRINDQLVAVNGESLLGRSNHAAMETLRRSMSQEGNVRGTIQLVVLRTPQDQHEASPNRSFDSSSGLFGSISPVKGMLSPITDSTQSPLVTNAIYASTVANGGYSVHMDDEDEGGPLSHGFDSQPPYLQERKSSSTSGSAQPQSPAQNQNQNQQQFHHMKASKSMDLVEDESNVGSLSGNVSAPPTPVELGPTLGLKKSSSLESLQTAILEVNRKNELLPFHRPRPNMVRGRGCNESFRAAIDKSYDGPAEDDEDEGSDVSSGRETPASSSSLQGAGDHAEDRSKKDKKKASKNKKKEKNKPKAKEKKKAEELEETKKSKKMVFGLLRFGKKKEEKKEAKAALQRQKSDLMSDHELERLKEERERIEASHPELQQGGAGASSFPDVEDDEADPNYARIQTFRDRESSPLPQPPQAPRYGMAPPPPAQRPSPQSPPRFQGGHAEDAGAVPDDEHVDRLYAKVNKQRSAGAASPATTHSSTDRIQQLRREYQQARREGAAPPYEEAEPRVRAHESSAHRIPGRGPDPRGTPRYEEVERQYASLPRRGPLDPAEYPMQPWSGLYPGPPQTQQGYPQATMYPDSNSQSVPTYSTFKPGPPYPRPGDHRPVDPGYYPNPGPQQRGPLRQDVPPSPTPPLRVPRYDTMTRGTVGGAYR